MKPPAAVNVPSAEEEEPASSPAQEVRKATAYVDKRIKITTRPNNLMGNLVRDWRLDWRS
jgi:hypothetical protein